MIHQLIFAHPKPGMSEHDFQDYWLNYHGPKLASKIPQIRRYMIDSRIPFGPEPDDPLFSGVAEIWLENEETSAASLQTPELLARAGGRAELGRLLANRRAQYRCPRSQGAQPAAR